MRVSTVFAVLLLSSAFAGCTAPEETPGVAFVTPQANDCIHHGVVLDNATVSSDFSGVAAGAVPAGWTVDHGDWAATEGAMGGVGDDAGLSILLPPAGDFQDFEAQVCATYTSDVHPAGAGLVLNYQDSDNYQIIRLSLSEQGWNLFTMHQGNRDKQRDANTGEPGHVANTGEWFDLRVRSEGGHVTAYQGDALVLDYTIPAEMSHSGQVGLFIRGPNGAVFDDFSVAAL